MVHSPNVPVSSLPSAEGPRDTPPSASSPASLVPAPVEVAGVSAPLAADSPAFLPTRIPSLGSQAARGQVTREACEHETQASEGLKLNRGAQQGAPPPALPSSPSLLECLCAFSVPRGLSGSRSKAVSKAPASTERSPIVGETKQMNTSTHTGR